jgi:hypothetical protein
MPKSKNADAIDLLKPDYKHVGKHRARKTSKDRWTSFLVLTIASVVLSAGGYLGLQSAVSALTTPAPTKSIVNGVDLSLTQEPWTLPFLRPRSPSRKRSTELWPLESSGLLVNWTLF